MSCKKASYIIEKREISKISSWEKFSLKFHLAICKLCNKYESDSKILGKILKGLHSHKTEHHLSAEVKTQMKQKLSRL